MTLLLRNGRLLDPASGCDARRDVLIDRGRVVRIARGVAGADEIFDARDRWVVPGLVDLHVHLRDPGQEHKEDLTSGSAAAAAGGFTTVCCMPNTEPPLDTPQRLAALAARAAESACVRVLPVGAISSGIEGRRLTDHAAMRAAGAVALSDDGRCIQQVELMRQALESAARAQLLLMQHCERYALSRAGPLNEGDVSRRIGVSGQPAAAEAELLRRDLELLAETGGRYHAQHVSVAQSLTLLRQAKARGLAVTCEATPHHLTLSDEACATLDPQTKVNPPLRSGGDVEALREALAEGLVDAVATDHAPHAREDKQGDFGAAAFGFSGLETALPLCLDLWREGLVTPLRLVELLSAAPARIARVAGGRLAEGVTADLTVVDPERAWIVDPARLRSKGRNTPFAGREMRGAAVLTVVGGAAVFRRDGDG